MEPFGSESSAGIMAAPAPAANDNAPTPKDARYSGRRSKRLLEQLQRETGIYWGA